METAVEELETSLESLSGYDACERFAIIEHKYLLGIDLGFDPGLQCAVASWEAGYAVRWRQERQLADCQDQMAEIERYRAQLSRQSQCEVSWETAAKDWIAKYAAQWRVHRDCQQIA